MVVKMQRNGRAITGVHIGTRNIKRYFHDGQSAVELELDHLHIRCNLEPTFWSSEPYISDPRLSAWLEAKSKHDRSKPDAVSLSMVPAGENRFRLYVDSEMKSHAAPDSLKQTA